nr:uncharacterized protein LOC109175453 [Ipomoea batatas]
MKIGVKPSSPQDVRNDASHPVEAEPSKRPRSMIPSRMKRETDIHISCGEVLKVQPRTIVHTRVHKGENEESVGSSDDVAPPQGEEASSFHITLCDEIPIEGEDAEEAPLELEEGQKSQPLVMYRAVLEPQSQVLGALAFHHGSWSTALCFMSRICLSTLPLKEETLSAGVSFRFLQISCQTPAIMAIYFDMKESATGRIET